MSQLFQKLKKERERIEKDKGSRGGGNYEKIAWWKPEKGDNLVRILPDVKNPEGELPFRRIAIHFIKVKNKEGGEVAIGVRCLNDHKEGTCPICNEYEKLVKKDKDRARDLRARDTYLYNVLDYKSGTVHPWSAGITIHDQIMGFAEDFSDNIFSTEAGRDWKIVKKVDPRKPRHLGVEYSVRPATKDTAMPAKMKPVADAAIDLDTLYQDRDDKRMIEFLEEYGYVTAKPKAPVDDYESDFDEEPVKPKAVAKPKPKVEEEDDVPDFTEWEKPAAKPSKPPVVKAAKKPVEDEDFDINTDDDDLEAELRELLG
jgi:hypothetical protein